MAGLGTVLLGIVACDDDPTTPSPARKDVPPERANLYARLEQRTGVITYIEEISDDERRLRGVFRDGKTLLREVGAPALQVGGRAATQVSANITADLPNSQLLFIIHPAGPKTLGRPDTVRYVFGADCQYLAPDGRWYVERVLSATVQTLENRPIWGSGGHGPDHDRPKPSGTWSPRSGQFDANGFFISLFRANVAAGDDTLMYVVSPNDGPCAGDTDTLRTFAATRVLGLVPLETRQNLTLIPATSDHPDVRHVTPQVRDAVYATAERYAAATSGSDYLRMTAASTPFGGINDIGNNWRPSHSTHRIGADVDFDGKNDSPTTHRAVIRAGERSELGARRCEPHGPRGRAPNHVHCYYGPRYLD